MLRVLAVALAVFALAGSALAAGFSPSHRPSCFGGVGGCPSLGTEPKSNGPVFGPKNGLSLTGAGGTSWSQRRSNGASLAMAGARERGVKRFVQISTDEVMGSLPEDENTFFTETSPLMPNSPYAASKAAAEFSTSAH